MRNTGPCSNLETGLLTHRQSRRMGRSPLTIPYRKESNMSRKLCSVIFVVLLLAFPTGSLYGLTPEESLKENFPQLKYEIFNPSPLKGIYEVIARGRITYYSPEHESLFQGEIITKDGRNITKEKALEQLALKLKTLPLDKAVKIGRGENIVIEFSDPDDPHSRQAAKFFGGRNDVTRYVFFITAPAHRKAEPKVRYIFCAEDKAKAYEEAMTGKLDKLQFKLCEDEKMKEHLITHRDTGAQLGIMGTPYFFVNGKPVRGANVILMKKLLEEKEKK